MILAMLAAFTVLPILAASAVAQQFDGINARIIDTNDTDDIVNRVIVNRTNCVVDDDASVVVEDSDGTRVTLTNGSNVDIQASDNRVTIDGTGSNGNIDGISPEGGDGTFEAGNGKAVESSGIACDARDDGDDDDDNGASDDQYRNDDAGDDNDDVIDDSVPDKPLPNTGGMPLSGLLIVGFALVCGGAVVSRSGIRREE